MRIINVRKMRATANLTAIVREVWYVAVTTVILIFLMNGWTVVKLELQSPVSIRMFFCLAKKFF